VLSSLATLVRAHRILQPFTGPGYATLYRFKGYSYCYNPVANLLNVDNALYGTTTSRGYGVRMVFIIRP